ncbi:MAG: phosphoadenosine phosphosulfate reductase family protein [Flavobacteriales bacterium]|nr:phosphoadenosine phosphosulfate reductase family protein [Flavobacteriales bacterium]
MSTNQLNLQNESFKLHTPEEIAQFALKKAKRPVITTNFRPYESAILHLVSRIKPDIPVIWCDTGYNTPATYRHAKKLIAQLDLNIFLYVPAQTKAYRSVFLGMPEIDTPEHDLFTAQVKLEPFRRAMREHNPDVWFTNLRKGQTPFRNSLDVFSTDSNGLLKVSPFYHWTDPDLDLYLKKHKLDNEFNYYDPTKVLSDRECGLHTN